MKNNYRQIKTSLLVVPVTVLLMFTANIDQARAIPYADPGDNGSLRVKLNALTGSSLGSMIIGLVPFWPVSVPAEIASFSTEIGVRKTPAGVNLPPNKQVFPNIEPAGAS